MREIAVAAALLAKEGVRYQLIDVRLSPNAPAVLGQRSQDLLREVRMASAPFPHPGGDLLRFCAGQLQPYCQFGYFVDTEVVQFDLPADVERRALVIFNQVWRNRDTNEHKGQAIQLRFRRTGVV